MVRRKFRNSQRKPTTAEFGYQEFLTNQQAPTTNRTELIRLIRGGEDTFLELKLKLSNSEKIAQEIVALANTAGGTIVFGVNDQLRVEGIRNPEGVQAELARICRNDIIPPIIPLIDQIYFDSGAVVIALDVQTKNAPYRTIGGKFFVRIGNEKREATSKEFAELLDRARPLGFENLPIAGVKESDIEDSLLWSFISAYNIGQTPNTKNYDTQAILKKDLMLAIGNGDEFYPTVSALLLFGSQSILTATLPHVYVRAIRFAGKDQSSEIIEEIRVDGNLLVQFEQLLSFVERYTQLWKNRTREINLIKNSPAGMLANYHLYSIREALANMLVHRDYLIREHESKILIFEDSIEFVNPRRTQDFVPTASKAIRYGITQRLNPQIVSIFSRKEYGLNLPQGGLPMIIKQSEIFSGSRVEIYTSGDLFRIKIAGI